ncbi:SusD/RagB family nutrient-binding outer membrane lipoprotein [uncultured Muribaculum sp.]|uniref:SusD/RagB family nutrient-binding outer membrane lipoprotein n=1 Tax=uncultured Muribaculum sp. TaxID=1918613 RepID=UPI0025D02BEF|nr:SusD/RagB family nutrient-binding outer membrane lipoprotein [uncultured Muribaculum sp.]
MSLHDIIKSRTALLAAVAVGALATSCIDYEDNVNPDEATEEMMTVDNLKAGSFFNQMQRGIILFQNIDGNRSAGDYQITQGYFYDALGGYAAATIANAEWNALYAFKNQGRKAVFDAASVRVMSPWKQIHEMAEAEGLATLDALAAVVKIAAMHRAADTFGSIAYINFGKSPNYDSLEEIYKKFFEELDNSITVLSSTVATGNTTMLADYDVVYGGDLNKWLKFANTLRLRLAMRCSYADPALAKEQAEKSTASSIGFIESADDRAELRHNLISYIHPYSEIIGWHESKPAASIIAYMNGYEDPRRTAYFTPGYQGGYYGVLTGLNTANTTSYKDEKGTTLSELNIPADYPLVWMFAAESFFLRAEGAIRGWNMGGDAQSFYKAGVEASFNERGVTGADTYLNSTKTPGQFRDMIYGNNRNVSSTITPKWDNSADFETKLERIITQKWIAMFPEGCEAWSEQRRTGYPKLIPVLNNASGGTVDAEKGARRIPFPDEEYSVNAEGVATGVANLGGPDNGGTKVWWDKK